MRSFRSGGHRRNLCPSIFRSTLRWSARLSLIWIAAGSMPAWAYPFYFDVQGGAGEFLNTSPPFGTSGSTPFGVSGAFGFFYTPFDPRGGVDVQLGVQSVYLSSTQGAFFPATLVPYPTLRLQFWITYLSLGVTPWAWGRWGTTTGLDSFGLLPNTLAYLGEFGVLYPATPKFSMGVGGTAQMFSTGGAFGSTPAISGHFVLRFYFTIFGMGEGGAGGDNTPLEFKGWRYIGK